MAKDGGSWVTSRWFLVTAPLLIVAYLAVTLLPMTASLFPADEQVSCTVQGESSGGRRVMGSVYTDCGSFQWAKTVPCSTDEAKKIPLVIGRTYDLTVQGPRIPVVMSPRIKSATVSPVQKFEIPAEPEIFDSFEGLLPEGTKLPESKGSKAIDRLREQMSPDRLRAYDYEQPPHDPSCNLSQSVMTADGLILSWPALAEQLLQVPEGVTPRDPKLPCEGYRCSAP